ncbi:lipopolysaccharide biosynthesis protein [Agarivorans aestuarii]|uniref:lipopolysaccharide biosynthesis protein n=1 Tax=Agarivorans aestuarii TaxID=1563703 RepID=UPI001C822A22|nr:lipopolysaccharide biosynthesis protein [Agarivorans aestuarii]
MSNTSPKSPLKHQVIHSLKWVAAGKILTQILRWVTTFWVIRLLTPEDYALVAMADVLSGFIVLIISSLFSSAIIQKKELTNQILRKMFGAIICVHITLFILQFLLATPVGNYYQSEGVTQILKVNAWCLVILAFEVIPAALLAKKMDFKAVSIIEAASNSIAAIATLIFAHLGFGFWSIIYGQVLFTLLKTILTFSSNPFFYLPIFSFVEIKPMLKFGGSLSILSMLFYVFLHMDIVIAGRVMSHIEVGLYAVGLQIAMMPQKKIMPLLRQVAYPAFSTIQDSPILISSYVLKSQKLCLAISLPIFWGLASIVDSLIPIILGEKWIGAIIPATLILLVMPLRFSEELFNPALKSLLKIRHMFINAGILLLVITPAILIGVNYGSKGLGIAWALAFPIAYTLISFRNCRAFNIKILTFFKEISSPFVAGLLMSLSLKLYSSEIEFSSSILLLLTQVLLGAFVYTTCLWVIDKNLITQLKTLKNNK